MKMLFKELPLDDQARLGLRWSKDAAAGGLDASKIAAADAGERAGLLGAKFGEDKAAKIAAEAAARDAAAAEAGPIGDLYDAITVVGMSLDLADVGHYMSVTQTSDFLKMKQQFDVSFQNVNLVPRGNPPVVGNFPSFFGPLDAIQQNISIEDFLALQTSNSNAIITSSDGSDIKARILALIKSGTSDMPAIPGTISDENFLKLYPAYISDADATTLANMTLQKMCSANGGTMFTPGPNIDPVCTYKTLDDCHAAAPWPPPSDDSVNYTYTEWRKPNYFTQFKNGDGTNTYTGIPTGGACTVQSDALHQLCDKTETTPAGTAGNAYKRDTGECVNSREYCRIKGISYTDHMDPSQMAGLGSGPLPSCYIGENQEVLENIIGSSTIYRFFSSGGDVAAAQQIATHIPTVSASSVGSGNSTVDNTVATLANAGIAITNGLTNALSATAVEAVQTAHAVANSEYQALVNPVVDAVSGNAGSIGTNVGNLEASTVSAATNFGTALANGDPLGALGAGAQMVAAAGATALSIATAAPMAVASGVSGELQTALSGNPVQAVNNVVNEANNINNTANSVDSAAASGNVQGVISGSLSVAAQSLALAASAVTAPVAAAASGVVSEFSTVGSGNPNAAFTNVENQANAMNSTAHNIDNAINSGNAGAAVEDIAQLSAQSIAVATAAITAPLAAATTEVANYVTNITSNPTQAMNSANNSVVSAANQVQNGINSGNSNQVAAGIVNVVGNSLNAGATDVVGGVTTLVDLIANAFNPPDPDACHNNNFPPYHLGCDKGFYGGCNIDYCTWNNYQHAPTASHATAPTCPAGSCSCPGGTINSAGFCLKPTWAQPCNLEWSDIIGKTSLHQYCWSDAQNAPLTANKCCAADPTWLNWAKSTSCANSPDGQCPVITQEAFLNPPINCQVSDWTSVGMCVTSVCGKTATQHQTRTVIRPAANGGAACPALSQDIPCDTKPCPTTCPAGMAPDSTGLCAACPVNTYKDKEGLGACTPCKTGATSPAGSTSADACACPANTYKDSTGACKACGKLTQSPAGSTSVAACKPAQGCDPGNEFWFDVNAGTSGCRPCGQDTYSPGAFKPCAPCPVGQTTRGLTGQSACQPPAPVDCQVSGWSDTGSCSYASCGVPGTKPQSRTVTQQPANGGAACPALTQNASCDPQPCPIDCQVSDWTNVGICTATVCGTSGTQAQSRTITQQPAYGGAACPPLTQSVSCDAPACTSCPSGKYLNRRRCEDCTTDIPPGKYISAACSGRSDTQFASCTTSLAPAGKYISAACSKTADTQFASCTTSVPGKYKIADCLLTSDAQFAPCTTSVPGKFMSSPCTATADAQFSTCTEPDWRYGQYVSSVCTSTSDTQISSFQGCPNGSRRVGVDTGSSSRAGNGGQCVANNFADGTKCDYDEDCVSGSCGGTGDDNRCVPKPGPAPSGQSVEIPGFGAIWVPDPQPTISSGSPCDCDSYATWDNAQCGGYNRECYGGGN